MNRRIIANTVLTLTRPDGKSLGFGEGQAFEIYAVTGLGIGEIEKETVGNALMDGELWLGSRVINRVIELESAWHSAAQRAQFTDFFQHNVRFDIRLEFNKSSYYGSCVLHEAYQAEQHGGRLHSGSSIELALYFDDPHLYTDIVYRYQIGYESSFDSLFYTRPAQFGRVINQAPGLRNAFSLFREAREYLIDNPSSTPNGIEARITARGEVVNPRLTNLTTGLSMQFSLTMSTGQELYVNTQSGFIRAVWDRADGPAEDVLRLLTLQSRMIQMAGGRNVLLFNPDQGADKAGCEISFRGKVLAL